MANWGLMGVELDAIVTDVEVLEAAHALWDSYGEHDQRPLRDEWHDGFTRGGRDRCLAPGPRISGTNGTVWIHVDAWLYELWYYGGERGMCNYDAVLGLVERLGRLFPRCRVSMSGDSSLHTETIEISREEVVGRLRAARAAIAGSIDEGRLLTQRLTRLQEQRQLLDHDIDAVSQMIDALEHEADSAEALEHETSEPPQP